MSQSGVVRRLAVLVICTGLATAGAVQAQAQERQSSITISKQADANGYAAGDPMTFTIQVWNSGDGPLTDVAVADPRSPECARGVPDLDVGELFSYTCVHPAPVEANVNIATATALDGNGREVTASDAEYAPTGGSIAGRVFSDVGGDGSYEPAEGDTPIADVAIGLGADVSPGFARDFTWIGGTTTGSDGTFTFDDVGAGEYRVRETQPADFDDGQDTPGDGAAVFADDAFTVQLEPGQASAGHTFADVPTSGFEGAVYADGNDDGVRDAGEPGIEGVEVGVSGTDSDGNAVSRTATTGPDGDYSLARLRPGTYDLTESQPSGYDDGKDTPGSVGGNAYAPDSITKITLPARTVATGYTFGEARAVSLSGRVVDDEGTGIPDVSLSLSGDAISATGVFTATTGPDGGYSFAGVPPGTYTLTEEQPLGYGNAGPTPGTAGGTPVGNDTIEGITITGEPATGYTFTETLASLAGSAYADLNGDAFWDAGEPGIGQTQLVLTGTDARGRPVFRSTFTDADGLYTFPSLLAGDYTITETQPAGYADGEDTPGTVGGTASEPDTITGITLPPGEQAIHYAFGERGSTVGGTVYADTDGDGTRDPGERGLGGVTVSLRIDVQPVRDLVETARATTAPDGSYRFTGIPADAYTVHEVQPEEYGSSTSDDVALPLLPLAGEGTADFGDLPGSVEGVVWSDADGDGLRDEDEAGVPDVAVTLAPTARTVRTDDAGRYRFDDLPAGTYRVHVTAPDGRRFTTRGTPGGEASDVDAETGESAPLPITVSGADITQLSGVDAGLVAAAVDLAASLTADDRTPVVGDPVALTARVRDAGAAAVPGARAVVTLPDGLTPSWAGGAGWRCVLRGQTATCTTSRSLAPGTAAPAITVRATAAAAFENADATLVAALPDGTPDANQANDSATVTISATAPPPAPESRPSVAEPLAETGSAVLPQLALSLLSLLAGGVALAASRRPRTRR